ncbi:MAG: hypothetical protein IKE69_00480 [Thermoguttaceae bacterium]|nr:hypothetical protein [Thermoguttaceae bacterium]
MNRRLVIDGNGLAISAGGSAIGNIVSVDNLPGWSKPEIEDTALDNTGVTSYILGNLKTLSNLSFTVKAGAEVDIPETNVQWVIGHPSGAIAIGFQGQLMQRGEPSVASGDRVLIPLTIKPTNCSSGGALVQPSFVTSGGTVTQG